MLSAVEPLLLPETCGRGVVFVFHARASTNAGLDPRLATHLLVARCGSVFLRSIVSVVHMHERRRPPACDRYSARPLCARCNRLPPTRAHWASSAVRVLPRITCPPRMTSRQLGLGRSGISWATCPISLSRLAAHRRSGVWRRRRLLLRCLKTKSVSACTPIPALVRNMGRAERGCRLPNLPRAMSSGRQAGLFRHAQSKSRSQDGDFARRFCHQP